MAQAGALVKAHLAQGVPRRKAQNTNGGEGRTLTRRFVTDSLAGRQDKTCRLCHVVRH